MNAVRYAGWMKELGYKVIVYAVNETPYYRNAVAQGLEVKTVGRNKKYFDIGAARKLSKQFEVDGISLVWFRDTRDMDTLGWAKRFSRGSFKLLYQQAMQFGVNKRDVFHTLRFSPIDVWVSTLDFLRKQVETCTRFSPQRIRVVPLGVDAARLRVDENLKVEARTYYGIDQDAFVFGVIGRLDALKGQHLAIEALHRLHVRGKKAHLLLLGEPTRNEGDAYAIGLRNLVIQHDMSRYVHFHPYSDEVFRFYHAIDVFMLCSKGETFGTVTIEAMACGLPIIGTNSSGTPEILDSGNCGLLVNADDVASWPDAMERMIASAEDACVMGQAAKKRFLENYSKEISVSRMQEIVDRCTSHEE